MSTSRTAPRITICGIPELGEHSAAAGVTQSYRFLARTRLIRPSLPSSRRTGG